MSYPFKINGYVYSPRTKEGFLRMKRQGIPRPLFSIQDKLSKLLKKRYDALIKQLLKDLKAQLVQNNITLDNAPEDDNLESLLKFFDDMQKEYQAENEKMIARINLNSVANTLEHEWLEERDEEADIGQFVQSLDKIFQEEQADYIKNLFSDASPKFQKVFENFTIDKKEYFLQNMENLRKLYIDNSLDRIKGEEDLIKRKMLDRIIAYATNREDELKLDDLTRYLFNQGEHLTRLFARDQMQRFNKACTLSTFANAGVTKVKWKTANDGRVRESHKVLNNVIFSIDNLPPEIDDYNCRCGLIPVEWADD